MADESKGNARLEIGHVLFLDIVGYSKRLTEEQSEALEELNHIVLATEAARAAETAGQLIRLPTGDGMALVFTGSIEDPVECALQISQALRAQPSLPVRMGIHSGPVHHVTDVNERKNIAGAGITQLIDARTDGHSWALLIGAIKRRRGEQEEGLRNFERSVELDPRNFFTLRQIANSYQLLRRYPEEAAVLDRALSIKPDDDETKVYRSFVPLNWKGETQPLHQAIEEVRAKGSDAIGRVAEDWVLCALAERDAASLQAALAAMGENSFGDDAVLFDQPFGEGLGARMSKDEAKARAAFGRARVNQEKRVESQPGYGGAFACWA